MARQRPSNAKPSNDEAARRPSAGEPDRRTPLPQPPAEKADDAVDYTKLPDEELMRFCQDGDENAFEQLFTRYQGPALSFIHRMIGDRNRTEALGQEAFLRIFKNARLYEYPRGFSTWFYTIVRNLCKNELRWRSRHPVISIEENIGQGGPHAPEALHIADNLHSKNTSPLDRMVGDELTKKLEIAIKDLPEIEREILILNRFQELKYKEIAEIVDLPIGAVRSRMHTALDRLRKSIKDYL